MIKIEYNTINANGDDVQTGVFEITSEMIARLIEDEITLDKSIEEEVDELNLFVVRK